MRNFVAAIACAGCTNAMMGVDDSPTPRHEPATLAAEPVGGPTDWTGDERFTDVERSQIVEGAAWLHARAGLPPPRITWGVLEAEVRPWTIRRERGWFNDIQPLGLCRGSAIFLAPDATEAELPGLVAHEMGHCVLGFADDPEGDGVMHRVDPMLWTAREEGQCAASSRCAR